MAGLRGLNSDGDDTGDDHDGRDARDVTIVLVVIVTGFGQEQDREKATRAGFDAQLTKPIDGAALAGVFADRASRGG